MSRKGAKNARKTKGEDMKYHRKTGLLMVVGLTLLLMTGCNNGGNDAKTTANLNPAATGASATTQAKPEVVMYKPPTCSCCTGWAEHLQQAGFRVVTHKREDMDAIKAEHGVNRTLASCHTAIVAGYVIEGHVPAADIERLLREHPDIVGLTAPGMPQKAPGMQSPGLPPRGYDVLAFDRDGKTSLFHRY